MIGESQAQSLNYVEKPRLDHLSRLEQVPHAPPSVSCGVHKAVRDGGGKRLAAPVALPFSPSSLKNVLLSDSAITLLYMPVCLMPPFVEADEPTEDHTTTSRSSDVPPTHLPGYPAKTLQNPDEIQEFLRTEFYCNDLERMAPYLWIMTTSCSSNINCLHRQKVKDRDIVITEDPRLHLVWIHNRIFIKPLPRYLCSHFIWSNFLDAPQDQANDPVVDTRRAALGFVRSYCHLVRYESDFRIAQEKGLVPSDVTWERFCRFVSALHSIEDDMVSPRYRYGELRLTRLNFYAPILLRKFNYEQLHGQYGDVFGRLFGPILFIFALVSTLLNSMQVGLAVEQLIGVGAQWVKFWYLCRWFSILSLAGTSLVTMCFATLWLWMFIDEWIYTIRRRFEERRAARGMPTC